ncbi:hypothetical protein HaLaN_18505 [Haematococcus lacustris]|uniref:Uncharacterized protein n=1 Tax=Haematococcus lacustris TaxID=44745 RepID=A0A699ZR59_HAELA|nr:hypothetical protein HaLaN_18505 [Haematococcus lacustris]
MEAPALTARLPPEHQGTPQQLHTVAKHTAIHTTARHITKALDAYVSEVVPYCPADLRQLQQRQPLAGQQYSDHPMPPYLRAAGKRPQPDPLVMQQQRVVAPQQRQGLCRVAQGADAAATVALLGPAADSDTRALAGSSCQGTCSAAAAVKAAQRFPRLAYPG